MPPLLHLPGIVSEATRRELERRYHPTQILDTNQARSHNEQTVTEALQHILPTRINNSSPNSSTRHHESRNLPAREVKNENFDDAYVAFIMYCNPSIALDTDTTELRRIFRAPPKSDGKVFSTFTLFELIQKLETKEIKTWAQLAIDLGVEPPALDKGQSAQKVQQYAVRLKRWLHAMHVDAFFEYLLNKSHIYWTHVPSPNGPVSDLGRDGVIGEEDLALRALLPETRPKRGRRKAEDRDNDEDTLKSPTQRRRLESPTLSEDFMIARTSFMTDATPVSAHPGFNQMFGDRVVAPWSAADDRGSHALDVFRWTHPEDAQTPMSAYPRSAITPSHRTEMWNDGSQSAITPNKARSRRRHGPAVSSAWPSSGSTSNGKVRGRPPSNKSVTDGPFSTFPVKPGNRDVPTINLQDNSSISTPVAGTPSIPPYFPPPSAPPILATSVGPNGRPNRLQLQVPQREGGAVRLATPPPVMLLNGHGESSANHDLPPMRADPVNASQSVGPQLQNNATSQFTPMMEYFTTPSTGDHDASFEHFVSIAFRQNEDADRTNVDALESHFISEILGADWYDGSGRSVPRCSIDEAAKICKQLVKNLQTESSSTEAFLINLSALAGGPLMTQLRMTRSDHETRTDYECHWKMRFGSIEGDFAIRAAVHRGDATLEPIFEDSEASWKQRFLDLQQQIRERDQHVGELKRGLLDAIVVSNKWKPI